MLHSHRNFIQEKSTNSVWLRSVSVPNVTPVNIRKSVNEFYTVKSITENMRIFLVLFSSQHNKTGSNRETPHSWIVNTACSQTHARTHTHLWKNNPSIHFPLLLFFFWKIQDLEQIVRIYRKEPLVFILETHTHTPPLHNRHTQKNTTTLPISLHFRTWVCTHTHTHTPHCLFQSPGLVTALARRHSTTRAS